MKVVVILAVVDIGLCAGYIKTRNSSFKVGRNVFEGMLYSIIFLLTSVAYIFSGTNVEQIFNAMVMPFTICVSASSMCNCLEGIFQKEK